MFPSAEESKCRARKNARIPRTAASRETPGPPEEQPGGDLFAIACRPAPVTDEA